MTPDNIFVMCLVITWDTSSIIGRISIVIPPSQDDGDADDDDEAEAEADDDEE
jgi:hypothetical protein